MKRMMMALLLVGVTWAVAPAAGVRDISSTEAKQLMDRNRNVFLLDVRTPEERRQGYIADSVLIPIDMVERRLGEIPRNRPVVVYCAVGSRSRFAAQLLASRGDREVYNMRDGIVGWYRNRLPIRQ
jgi:rhodanese-related sulfurtransferase